VPFSTAVDDAKKKPQHADPYTSNEQRNTNTNTE